MNDKPRTVSSVRALHPGVNQAAYAYYVDVINEISAVKRRKRKTDKGIGVVIVVHSYETVFALVSCIDHFGPLRGVILKHSTSRFPEVGAELTRRGIPVLGITKADMKNDPQKVVSVIEDAVPKGERFVLMDHGGYFAFGRGLFDHFKPERLVGVVEHTLNGEVRYESLQLLDRPVVSIGQSSLKLPSDQAASDAIILASDAYLQQGGVALTSPMVRIGIIGYGRLGARIGTQLQANNASHILVSDTNPSKLAGMRGHIPTERENVCKKCDIIFCATGNRALRADDFSQLKSNAVIFTVTSPDDELGLDTLVRDGVLSELIEKRRGDTFIYRVNATGREIMLPFNGESPNTSLPYGIAHPVIHQPYAAHIAAAISVINNPGQLAGGLSPLRSDLEHVVSSLWVRHFGNPDFSEQTKPAARQRNPRSPSAAVPVRDTTSVTTRVLTQDRPAA